MLLDLSGCSSWSPQQAAGPFAFPSPGRANTPLQSWGLLWFSPHVPNPSRLLARDGGGFSIPVCAVWTWYNEFK